MDAEPAYFDLGPLQAEAIGHLTKRDFTAAIDGSAVAAAAIVESIGPLEQCRPEQLPQVQRAAALFSELALAYTLRGDVARSAGPMEQAIRYGQRARALMPTPDGLGVCPHGISSETGLCEHPLLGLTTAQRPLRVCKCGISSETGLCEH